MNHKNLSEAWVIKYKPKTIDELLAPAKVKERWSGSKNVSALFSGAPGTGKSSLADILTMGHPTLFIDGSTDNGIDVVRHKILNFATTTSLKSGRKKIILDEIDGFTVQAQKSLKATMDKVSNNVDFIVTSNHPERLIDALHSRFEHTIFEFTKQDLQDLQIKYITRIKEIVSNEGFKISNEALTYLLESVFPDIRQTLIKLFSVCQTIKQGDIITKELIDSSNASNFELYAMLTTPKTEPEMYKFVMSTFHNQAKNAFSAMGDQFLQWLIAENKQPEMVLTIASIVHKYQYETSMTSYNPMLGLLACCNAINSFFKQR
jgi:replication factor C small subunit